MSAVSYFFFVILTGFFITFQGIANAKLAQHMGLGQAILINSMIVVICAIVFLFLKNDVLQSMWQLQTYQKLPVWTLLGGFCGFGIITITAYIFPLSGVTLSIVGIILFQALFAFLFDTVGFFGPPIPISWTKILGTVLMVAGFYIMKKG